jgi:hypothetical protein
MGITWVTLHAIKCSDIGTLSATRQGEPPCVRRLTGRKLRTHVRSLSHRQGELPWAGAA